MPTIGNLAVFLLIADKVSFKARELLEIQGAFQNNKMVNPQENVNILFV